jgi:PPK2 family polyphosphate:nucleotide phosphotransferase
MKQFITELENLDKKQVNNQTEEICREIGELQYKMMAEEKRSILLILQGPDASGKDGLVRDLLEFCNPVGISVYSFKKPTPVEYAHDFLWRVHKQVPAKGMLQVFNRSQYEDILVPSVEGFIPAEVIEQRYGLINDFERLVQHNGTTILKFFMSVSAERQMERLRERTTNPEKHWKHNDGDWETFRKRDLYMEKYGEIMERCNDVPWHVIPCDRNWQKLYVAAGILLKTLREMNLQWPPLKSAVFNT